MNCDCSIDTSDFDAPSFFSRRIVKAAKVHHCCECDADIVVGERHQYTVGKWDGAVDSSRTCLPCMRIADHYCPGGYTFCHLAMIIDECLGFDYREIPEEEGEDE